MKEEKAAMWGVRLKKGGWLGFAHGIYETDGMGARLYKSREEAEDFLEAAAGEWNNYLNEAEVVEGWEPECLQLRREAKELKKLNKISPENILDVEMLLGEIREKLRIR